MSLSCSFNIKVENITDIIGKDTFKNLTQEECESVITQLMSSYNLTQEALLDNKYKSDIINAIKRGREEASKAISVSTTIERVLENEKAITILENEGITLDNSLIDKYLLEVKASNPYHQIFKQIVGILKNNNIPINVVVNSSLSNIAARKQDGFKTATIEINPTLLLDYLMTDNKDNVKENLMKILTHELVHAVTAEILNYHPSWAKIKGFNEAQTEFSNNVWNLYLQCKEQLKGTEWYGLTNAKEFIAVALTDRNFQIELSKIKLDKNENAFKRFINYLTNLFNKVFKAQGIDIKNSALEEIISISQEYFDSANKDLRGGIYDYTGTRDYYDNTENNSTKENKDFKISIATEGYRKGDPQKNPNINYVFTENAQAYVWATHNDDFAADVAEYIKPKLNVSDVNGTNQAGIRTDSKGNISSNAYGIVVKKYQQDANGKFVAKEGQFQDTDEDFNLFTALNKDMFNRLSKSPNKEIKFPSQMALGKAALPLRFTKWLQNELSTRFGIDSTIEKNTKAGYEGYGLKIGTKQNVIKESEYSKQLIKILQSLVNKIKASNIKEAKAAQNLYEWTIKAQQTILDAIERGERKDEDLSLDKVQEQLNNLIQKTPENLAEDAIKAAKEMGKDWGKNTEQKSKKETKKSDKTLKETIESAKAKRPAFDSIETGKIQKRLLSIYFPNVTERIAATNFISDYFSIILDNTVSDFKEAISNNEEAFRDKLGDEEYERLYKGLFSGNSAQQRVFALGLTLGEKAVPLQIFDRVKNLIDSFKNTQDIKELVYQWYLNKDNTVKMDSFLGNEFSWEANQNGWDTPKKLEEMATLRVRAMKSYFTKHFGDDRVFDALVKEAAFDIEFNENIRLDTRGNIMENNQEREDKENDVENEEENPNKEGYMIKYKLLDPIDTISVKLKNKLAHLYKMNFNLKRNNDVEYVFNSLGLRVKLNPMIAYYTVLNEFQSISSEDELDGMFEDAVTKYPWLQSLKDNVVFNPLVPQEFDIDFRKEFFRACKSFAPFAMVTKDGTIAYLNRDNQSTTFLDMVKTSYEGHNVLGENSIFNEDGTRNSGNVETIFYLLTSGERKDKEGKKKKDDVNKHPFFLVKNILKKNKVSVFELFTALQILRGEHPEYKSIKVNNVIYKDISLEGLLKNLGIETANMNLEALIPATFALEVDDEGNTIGSKESPEFTDDFIDAAEANGYSNPVEYFNSLFTPKMRRYLSTILEKATVITRPKQGYQNGDNLVIKFQNSYLSIGNALTMANEAYSQTSFRFNNNTRFSYVAYDMITRMSNLLSKTSTDEAVARGTKYLEDNYGQYDFFRDQKTGEWNNVWLQQWFEQDEHGEYTIRENFKILNMLGFGGNEDKDSFGKVSSETLMDSHILAFLNGNKDKWGNEYGYYRNALFSDTDASILVKQIRYTGDNYKEVIVNNLAKVLRQEIERIISVMKSSEDPNTIKIEFYNEGKKNGQKFNFFPALNAKEKYIQVLTEYNRLSQLNSAEFKEQSDKFLAGLVTDIIEGEVDPVTGLRTGGKLQEFLNSIDETRRKSLYRKILKINAAKEKSEESEEDEDSTKNLLDEVFGDEKESTKETTKKTSEEQRRELDEILTNFFYNDYFAQSQIIQIFGGDLAYYKNFRDFIKRNKQAYAAGDRLYGMLMDEQGNNIEPLTETAIYVEDKFELSNTYDSIKQLLNSAVGVSKMSRDLILGALSSYKNICATDGQSFRTPESIKKILQAMGGKWTDDMEEAFNRMTVEGKLDIKDFYTIWNNIKPFLYSHETVQVGDRKEKVVTQHKNSEYMMTAMYSMITSALSNSPQLKALQEFMKDNNIDVVHFHSVVKEGYFNGININYSIKRFNEKKGENDYIEVAGNRINADTYEDFRKNLIQALDDEKITQEDYNQAIRDIDFEKSEEGVDDCYNQLANAIYEEGEDGVYRINETKLHKFPLSDYMVVQPSGDHLTEDDLMAIFGSQLRNIIPADLPESFVAKVKLGNKNKEFTRDEYIKLYNTLIVDQLLDSFARVSDEFSSVEKLQSALLAKIHGNPKYGSDVEEALQLEDAGNGNKRFKIPFNNPNLNNKIEELLLSTFKNAIQKQKINGGNIILVSNFGLSDDLHVQYKTDENGNKCIDYIPCYMPAYKRSLIQDFLIPRRDSKTGEEWWEVDYEKMKGNEDLLEMIGYRI